MKKDRNHILFIHDIHDCIIKIGNYISNLDYESFYNDPKTIDAVIRNIEIIGEATKNIPNEIKIKFPDIPWKEMARMRDKITHWYFEIDVPIVWKVVSMALPEILPSINSILNQLKSSRLFENTEPNN
jgi:uncharacterized protein with HEPN domain